MKKILMLATLLGSLGLANPAMAAGWVEYRAEATKMTKEVRHHFPGAYGPDGVDKNLDMVWTLILQVERETAGKKTAIFNEIDKKVFEGSLPATTAMSLKRKTLAQFDARIDYLFGNLFRRVLVEMLSEYDPGDRAEDILGRRVRIAVTLKETNDLLKLNRYLASDYGLRSPMLDSDIHEN